MSRERMYASDPDFENRDWLTFLNHVVHNPQCWYDMTELTVEEKILLIQEIDEAMKAGGEIGYTMAKGINELDKEDILPD